MWQTPPLATAAQAFLLVSAFNLNPQTAQGLALLLFFFSFFVGASSIQLMSKHRYLERLDDGLLAQFEQAHAEQGYAVLHGPEGRVDLIMRNFLIRIKSFQLWVVILAGFCLVAAYGFFSRL